MIQHRDCGDESEAAMTDERAVDGWMRPYGNGWAFDDPQRRTPETTAVVPLDGGWVSFGCAPAGTEDDDDLPARIIARLAQEVTEERAKVSELTRLLGEAEEQRKSLGAVISALMSKREHFAKCKMLGMTDGEALAAILSDEDQVQRALKGASR